MSEQDQPNGWFEKHVVETLSQLQKDMVNVRIDLATHKAKTGVLAGLISVLGTALTIYLSKP